MTGTNKSSMQVFKSILLCHMYYLKNEKTLAKKFFNKARKWDESSNNSTPPIVRGRLAAWEYIIWGKLDLLKKYYLQESNVISKIETLEFAAKLIWQHKDQRIVLPFINEFDLAQLPTLTNFYQKGRADVMKLIMAINFLNTAKTKQAKTLVAEINPSNFHYSDRKWLQEKYQQVIRA
jgi:hypothetical protein